MAGSAGQAGRLAGRGPRTSDSYGILPQGPSAGMRAANPAAQPGPSQAAPSPGGRHAAAQSGAAETAGAPSEAGGRGRRGYGTVPSPGAGGYAGGGGLGGLGGSGFGAPGPSNSEGSPGGPAGGDDLEWWERAGAWLRSWRPLMVLRRIQAIAVWAALPVVLIALVVSEALRVSLAAWLGTVWVVFA